MKFYNSEMQLINLSDIRLEYNPRSNLGNLSNLKQSNKQKDNDKTYKIINSHRWYKVFDGLKYLQIPARILKLSDEEAENISFIDNRELKDCNPIDEAQHYKHMQDRYGGKVYSTRNLAKKYGMGKSYYHLKLQLLELPKIIQDQLSAQADSLTEKHCRHICKLLNKDKLQKKFEKLFAIIFDDWDEKQVEQFSQEVQYRQQMQITLANQIMEHGWSVRQTESYANELLKEFKEKEKQKNQVEQDIKDIEVTHRRLKKSIAVKSEERREVLYVMRTTQNNNYIESKALIERAKGKGVAYDHVDWDQLQGKDLVYEDRVRRLEQQIGKTYTDEELYSPAYDEKYEKMYEQWATCQGMDGGILYDE